MKYIYTFYIDMGLIWGSFFFTCRIGRWHANAAHNDAARLCCGGGVGDSEHDHIANGLGSVGVGFELRPGPGQGNQPNQMQQYGNMYPGQQGGPHSPYFSLSYRSFLQGSLIKDKEWGGWLNLWQPAETPLTSLTFQITGAYFLIVRFTVFSSVLMFHFSDILRPEAADHRLQSSPSDGARK